MQKLGALDGNFLYTETEKVPNHVSSVQIFELPSQQNFDQYFLSLKKFYSARIHLIPYLTRVLKFVPGNVDHPVWVKAPQFDIDNHITHVVLDAPGNFEQLELKVAQIHAELMDRSQPLWKLFVISGLKNGTIAFYNQAHHACIDGASGQAATKIMMDSTAEVAQVAPASLESSGDESMAELFRLSVQNFFNMQAEVPSRLLGNLDAAARFTRLALERSTEVSAAMRPAPKTRFNRMIDKKRTFAAGEMSVVELKAMGKIMNCKLNDIFMAVCAGGLRRYLERNNELPNSQLKAGCPVSLREPGSTKMDNQVTMMMVGLATDIRDPLLRLQAIINSSKIAKDMVQATLASYRPDISWYGLPAAITTATKMAETLKLAEAAQPIFNVVISNVPGPRAALYSNGARMLTHYPVSIPVHGQGLNITASSYIDKLYFSMSACALALPDATALRDDIATAYNEMVSLLLPNPNKVTILQPQVAAIPAQDMLKGDAEQCSAQDYKEAS